jgi:hypothetical protein
MRAYARLKLPEVATRAATSGISGIAHIYPGLVMVGFGTLAESSLKCGDPRACSMQNVKENHFAPQQLTSC